MARTAPTSMISRALSIYVKGWKPQLLVYGITLIVALSVALAADIGIGMSLARVTSLTILVAGGLLLVVPLVYVLAGKWWQGNVEEAVEVLRRQSMSTKEPTIIEQGPPTSVPEQATNKSTIHISEERIYEETAKVAAIFWEWRHKIMTHFFAGIPALLALTYWFYQQAESSIRIWLCAPLLLGATFSYISFLLDKRNARILRACYSICTDIEVKSGQSNGAIFKFIEDTHYEGLTYTKILQRIYLIAALLQAGLLVVVIIYSLYRPS